MYIYTCIHKHTMKSYIFVLQDQEISPGLFFIPLLPYPYICIFVWITRVYVKTYEESK